MANQNQLKLLRQGVRGWNAWREKETGVQPDLNEAHLPGMDLSAANLSGANLSRADLSGANLFHADLRKADLSNAALQNALLIRSNLNGANLGGVVAGGANLNNASLMNADLSNASLLNALLIGANLSGASLRQADLGGTNLLRASLASADLRGASLHAATLVETDLVNADLTNCVVYGISAWGLRCDEHTKQQSLVITRDDESKITTDDIEVAQFLYLMLHNKKIRRVIDTITSKVVLILGRFTSERKAVLDALREELRKPGRNYVPVMFDFDRPANKSTAETVALLARMSRFVIADLTDAKSVLQELRDIVPNNPMLAVQPLIIATQDEPGMFDFFKKFPWVLKTYRYDTLLHLRADLDERVIRPTEAKVLEVRAPQLG